MRKLHNTQEDIQFLYSLLLKGDFPKATFSLGTFTTDLMVDAITVDHFGIVTEIDLESGYCNWRNEYGQLMPCVKINCITLI